MGCLEEILKEWSYIPGKDDNQFLIKEWMRIHRETTNKNEFIDNLLQDRELSRDHLETLACVLLEINNLPIEDQKTKFDKWANDTRLKGRNCDAYTHENLYHVTTDVRLKEAIISHGNSVSDNDFRDAILLTEKIKKLSHYTKLQEERAIWVTWKTEECPCPSVIDIFDEIVRDRTIEEEDNFQKLIPAFRDAIANAISLDTASYEKSYIIILCYKLPPNLNVKVPTIADARWNNCLFKPKNFSDNCGKSRARVPCNEGVHKNVDLSALKGIAILRPVTFCNK
jgi:hypothetical protein